MQITTSVPEQLLYFNDWLAGKLKCFKAKSPQISGCSSAAVRIRCFPIFYIIVSWLSLGFWSDERRLDTILVKQTILNIRLLMPLQNRIKFFLHTALEKKKSLKTNIFFKNHFNICAALSCKPDCISVWFCSLGTSNIIKCIINKISTLLTTLRWQQYLRKYAIHQMNRQSNHRSFQP